MSARELLDIAADYAQARDNAELARAHGGQPVDDLDTLAARFEVGLAQFVAAQS